MKGYGLAIIVVLTTALAASGGITYVGLTQTLGDEDGFGVGCPIASGQNYLNYGAFGADYRQGGDPDFTDVWQASDSAWTHLYNLGGMTPTSATLEIFVAGVADYAIWSAAVRVDGTSIGTIPGLEGEHDLTRLLSYDVPTGLIDGSDAVTFDVSSFLDGYIIDYSKLSIDGYKETTSPPGPGPSPVPAPGAAVLAAIGIGLVGWLRRRKEAWL